MALGHGKTKQRDSQCYDTKVRRMKAWHARLLRLRDKAISENPALATAHRWKALKPIEAYIAQIKRPVGGDKK